MEAKMRPGDFAPLCVLRGRKRLPRECEGVWAIDGEHFRPLSPEQAEAWPGPMVIAPHHFDRGVALEAVFALGSSRIRYLGDDVWRFVPMSRHLGELLARQADWRMLLPLPEGRWAWRPSERYVPPHGYVLFPLP